MVPGTRPRSWACPATRSARPAAQSIKPGDEHLVVFPKAQRVIQPDPAPAQTLAQLRSDIIVPALVSFHTLSGKLPQQLTDFYAFTPGTSNSLLRLTTKIP